MSDERHGFPSRKIGIIVSDDVSFTAAARDDIATTGRLSTPMAGTRTSEREAAQRTGRSAIANALGDHG